MEKFYSLSKKARKKIIEEVKKTLQKREEIAFAYLYKEIGVNSIFVRIVRNSKSWDIPSFCY